MLNADYRFQKPISGLVDLEIWYDIIIYRKITIFIIVFLHQKQFKDIRKYPITLFRDERVDFLEKID